MYEILEDYTLSKKALCESKVLFYKNKYRCKKVRASDADLFIEQ